MEEELPSIALDLKYMAVDTNGTLRFGSNGQNFGLAPAFRIAD